MKVSRTISIAFVISMLASIALVIVYVLGGNRAAEGILLGLALGGLGAGIVLWTRLIDSGTEVEEREPLESTAEDVADTRRALGMGEITRRSLLVRLVTAAGGTLAAALAPGHGWWVSMERPSGPSIFPSTAWKRSFPRTPSVRPTRRRS
jgi:hypothetical protein